MQLSRTNTLLPSRIGQSSLFDRGITLGIYFHSCLREVGGGGGQKPHRPVCLPCDSQHARSTQIRLICPLPRMEISSGILTGFITLLRHWMVPRNDKTIHREEPFCRMSGRGIMPTHVYCTMPTSFQPGAFFSTSAGEAHGWGGGLMETRHEAGKLNPSGKYYFPPVGLFSLSCTFTSVNFPRPGLCLLSHACSSPTSSSQGLRLPSPRCSRCLASTNSQPGQKGRPRSR